jgi:hypothetical protein
MSRDTPFCSIQVIVAIFSVTILKIAGSCFSFLNPKQVVSALTQLSHFDTLSPNERPFRNILQDPDIPTVFLDMMNNSDAIFAYYKGMFDLQLMELSVSTCLPYEFRTNLMSGVI